MKKFTVKRIAYIGIMTALVYVTSQFLQIPIATSIDNTRLHMGNVMCLLSGIILGPYDGGIAAGLGSMLFDLTNPAYVATAPLTFSFKFAMAYVCGFIIRKHGDDKKHYILACALGALTYVICYVTKKFLEYYLVTGLTLNASLATAAEKAVVSLANAVISVLVTVPLAIALKPLADKYTSQ